MDLPPGAARRTTYSLLSQLPPDDAPANVLQRQSSGSSYGAGSSISASSDYPFHLQPPASFSAAAALPAAAPAAGSPCKSWAQQAEETYQLQLALALRLCVDAASAADPGFLDPGGSGSGRAIPLSQATPSAEAVSHRFWVSSALIPFSLGWCTIPGRWIAHVPFGSHSA
jgi:serine/threonine-protein kinase CTR1